MVYPIIHDYPICLQCFIVTNIVSDTIWTYLDWLILHDAKKGQHLDQNLPPMAPLKTRHGSTRQSENLLSLGGIWFAMVCPTRIPQKWQAIKQTGIINLGKAMGTGLFPLHFQVRNPFEPSPKSSTLCLSQMICFVHLLSLQPAQPTWTSCFAWRSCTCAIHVFFKVVNVPNMDALNHLEINRAWMWYPKLI